jgi:hypothetical protein
MNPAEALRCATSRAAARLGLAGRVGAVQKGAAADLVALSGDPLEDIDVVTRPVFVPPGVTPSTPGLDSRPPRPHHHLVMARKLLRGSGRVMVAVLLVAGSTRSWAGVIASKAEDRSAPSSRAADIQRVRDVLARQEVAAALQERGLSPAQAEQRLAQLSDEDLRSLANHVDVVQAAGDVPKYIWILLAIFLAVSILVLIF